MYHTRIFNNNKAVNCVSVQQAGEERSKPVRSDKYGGHTP